MQRVVVQLDGIEADGLLLKWGREGERALVTYEVDGRVATTWVLAAQLRPLPDSASATLEPLAD